MGDKRQKIQVHPKILPSQICVPVPTANKRAVLVLISGMPAWRTHMAQVNCAGKSRLVKLKTQRGGNGNCSAGSFTHACISAVTARDLTNLTPGIPVASLPGEGGHVSPNSPIGSDFFAKRLFDFLEIAFPSA